MSYEDQKFRNLMKVCEMKLKHFQKMKKDPLELIQITKKIPNDIISLIFVFQSSDRKKFFVHCNKIVSLEKLHSFCLNYTNGMVSNSAFVYKFIKMINNKCICIQNSKSDKIKTTLDSSVAIREFQQLLKIYYSK